MAAGSDSVITAIGMMRDLFILGDLQIAKNVVQAVAPLNFIQNKPVSELLEPRTGIHFIVAICNFNDLANMQLVARSLTKLNSPDAHKIIYAIEPPQLDQHQLLFAIELGAKFTACGANKDFQTKEYIKRIAINAQYNNGLIALEREIDYCIKTRDERGLQRIADKLLRLPKDQEDVLRLQAITSSHLRLQNKSLFYVRKILTINPQNIWAACQIGKIYLRSNQIAEGLQILEKSSQFRDLTGKQDVNVGPAQFNSDDPGASGISQQTTAIDSENIANADGDQKDEKGRAEMHTAAFAMLNRPTLSEGVLEYINVRAVMAIKVGQIDDGIGLYHIALAGCHDDRLVRAKLYFNTGLAYAKQKNHENAIVAFKKSIELGGQEFNKAKASLDSSILALAKREKGMAASPKAVTRDNEGPSPAIDTLDEIKFDDL